MDNNEISASLVGEIEKRINEFGFEIKSISNIGSRCSCEIFSKINIENITDIVTKIEDVMIPLNFRIDSIKRKNRDLNMLWDSPDDYKIPSMLDIVFVR
jgi:hypothetical protein